MRSRRSVATLPSGLIPRVEGASEAIAADILDRRIEGLASLLPYEMRLLCHLRGLAAPRLGRDDHPSTDPDRCSQPREPVESA